MLTQNEVLEAVRAGRQSSCYDGRDYARLTEFFPVELWGTFGFKPAEGVEPPKEPTPWTRENILDRLEADNDFAFEKALNKRGISASFMYATVQTWLWILQDELADHDDYAQYGLPLFKAVAVKYGFDNPIGDDDGDEFKYSADADYDED